MAINHQELENKIKKIWERRDSFKGQSSADRDAVNAAVNLMDSGERTVIEKIEGEYECEYVLNEWLKQSILLMFRMNENRLINNGDAVFYDKVPLKFENWTEVEFEKAGIRVLPTSLVRISASFGRGVVVMSGSIVNVGARVGEGSMVDSGTTVGSCAWIGKKVHLSMNVGIGGVLEPVQARPVIIGDGSFIGPSVQIVEGVLVEDEAVIQGPLVLSKSTPIYDGTSKKWKEMDKGFIPAGAVVVPGVKNGTLCAVIKKYSDEQTKRKVSTNELLHRHNANVKQ